MQCDDSLRYQEHVQGGVQGVVKGGVQGGVQGVQGFKGFDAVADFVFRTLSSNTCAFQFFKGTSVEYLEVVTDSIVMALLDPGQRELFCKDCESLSYVVNARSRLKKLLLCLASHGSIASSLSAACSEAAVSVLRRSVLSLLLTGLNFLLEGLQGREVMRQKRALRRLLLNVGLDVSSCTLGKRVRVEHNQEDTRVNRQRSKKENNLQDKENCFYEDGLREVFKELSATQARKPSKVLGPLDVSSVLIDLSLSGKLLRGPVRATVNKFITFERH